MILRRKRAAEGGGACDVSANVQSAELIMQQQLQKRIGQPPHDQTMQSNHHIATDDGDHRYIGQQQQEEHRQMEDNDFTETGETQVSPYYEVGENLSMHSANLCENMSDHQQQPMFAKSRIDSQTFCAEFVSIAQTFEMSDRACNDLLNLLKRMAPPVNSCPEDFNDARLCFYDNHMPAPDVAAAVTLPPPICNNYSFSKPIYSLQKNTVTNATPPIAKITQQFKKRRGRPPGSTKTAKYIGVAEIYQQQKCQMFRNSQGQMTNDQQKRLRQPESGMKFEYENNVEEQQQFVRHGSGWKEQREEFVVVMDDHGQQQLQPVSAAHHQVVSGQPNRTAGNVMAKVLGSLDKLSKDVASLRRQFTHQVAKQEEAEGTDPSIVTPVGDKKSAGFPPAKEKAARMREIRQDFDRRRPKYFVKIFDENDQIVPICDMCREDMVETVRISREDPETRIIYHKQDITERVLQKLDISLHLHNPSYCGRAAADALFNPEFLSRFHILSEGQSVSRAHREILSPELTKVFYDTLRKLGASRIIPDDQFGWMEQARDAVNQRNRDIKIPGCRRKFFQNSEPIFE